MPRTICIDSNIVVWGVKKVSTTGQEDMIPLAEGFLDNLKKENAILLIPSPVITEILTPVPISDRAVLAEKINRIFRVLPIDTITAIKASELWHNTKNWKEIYKKKGQDGMKNRFKYDILIAAAAIVRNVDYFYTHDDDLITLCTGQIPAGKMPPLGLSPQLSLPLTDEDINNLTV